MPTTMLVPLWNISLVGLLLDETHGGKASQHMILYSFTAERTK